MVASLNCKVRRLIGLLKQTLQIAEYCVRLPRKQCQLLFATKNTVPRNTDPWNTVHQICRTCFQLSCHAVVKLLEVLLRIFKSSNPLWLDWYWWVPCVAAAWHAVLTINTVARLKALALAKRCSCRHCCFRCCFHRQPFLTLSDLFQVCFRLRKPNGWVLKLRILIFSIELNLIWEIDHITAYPVK